MSGARAGGGVREILKRETDPAHRRVDVAFGALDLRARGDFTVFLAAHARAIEQIEQWVRAAWPEGAFPAGLAAAARADLAALNAPAPAGGETVWGETARVQDGDPLEAVGAAYVVAGAHFGAGVLRKAWRESQDPAVAAAGRYLGSDLMKRYWPRFLARLEAFAPEPVTVQPMIAGALKAFAAFETALAEVIETRGRAKKNARPEERAS